MSAHPAGAGEIPRPDTSVPEEIPPASYARVRHWPRATELAAILIFWTFLAALAAASRFLDPRVPGIQQDIAAALAAIAFFEYFIWALLTIPIFFAASRWSLERGAWVTRLILFAMAGVLIGVLVDAAIAAVRAELLPVPRRAIGFWTVQSLARLRFVDDMMLYFAVLSAGIARAYVLREQIRLEETARLRAQAAQLQAQLADARLTALRIQLNPHFLFNTLHAVSALVERDPRGVRRMISRLSDLLRRTLEGTGEPEITLEEELDLLERYLDIMRIRHQGALAVEIDIDERCLGCMVPPLVLQPLVENAFKHGIARLESGGLVNVRGRCAGDRLQLMVEDNGGMADGETPESDGTGIGLENTAERLEGLYGSEGRVSLSSRPGGITVATVELPFRAGGVRGRESASGGSGDHG
jgi:two-component system, LytTR family, sensor kinase